MKESAICLYFLIKEDLSGGEGYVLLVASIVILKFLFPPPHLSVSVSYFL